MNITDEILKEVFVTPGHVSEADFVLAQAEAKRSQLSTQAILMRDNFISEENLTRGLADYWGYRFIPLRQESIDEKLISKIPEIYARNHRVIIFGKDDKGIKLAMESPDDRRTIFAIEKRLRTNASVYMASRSDIDEALNKYQEALGIVFQKFLKKIRNPDLDQDEKDTLMIDVVDMLLWYGQEYRASDIHIEPYADKIQVRFRIDGILHDVLDAPKEMLDLVLTRIKIISNLRIDEHQAPQDGKLVFYPSKVSFIDPRLLKSRRKAEGVDIRVSIMPVAGGENTVLRVLASRNREKTLKELGLSNADYEKAYRAVQSPHGMILVTGPTGSGKTTTAYAMLKILNTRDVHISTIEDPIEYHIQGISQIQVNTKANLTFATGLRSIVRQDPDIIMVGEVRDQETGGIAVNSALTGHLVLSTLHTNDAATTLPRLLDMSIEPFLVASTVRIVIAQRLVRMICLTCRVSTSLAESERIMIETIPALRTYFQKKYSKYFKDLKKVTVFKGAGCNVCNHTGYRDRMGIFEVLEMSDAIKAKILMRASSDEINEIAVREGMTTMFDDGMRKVFEGVTTFEEVIKAANA